LIEGTGKGVLCRTGGINVNKRQGWQKTAIIVIAVSLIMTFFMIRSANKFMNEVNQAYANLVISDVDLSQVPDGVHSGSFDVRIVAADVKVEVQSGRIESIEIVRHSHGRGAAAEAVTQSVLQTQSLSVDAVSGATMSSKVILKAIENALTGAALRGNGDAQAGTPAGQAGTADGRIGASDGQAGTADGRIGASDGQAGTADGRTGTAAG
jgi:uncharacterized protein with FMN-binding domain